MTTVREYFDTDQSALNAEREWHLKSNTIEINILCKLSYKLEDKTKLFSFFFPKEADFNAIKFILDTHEVKNGKIDDYEHLQEIKFLDNPESIKLSECFFIKNIFVYIDRIVDAEEKRLILEYGKVIGFNIFVRDEEYAIKCNDLATPLAFISHDFKDKDSLVRKLANELRSLNCPVWYDEYTLQLGDNLKEKIYEGIINTKYSIVVLSQNYISNKTWANYEFNEIFKKENNIIIPIWYGVSRDEVEKFAPDLSLIFAASIPILETSILDEEIESLAKELVQRIKK